MVNEGESAEHEDVFGDAESDVGERLRRSVAGQARGSFGGVTNQSRAAREERNQDGHGGAGMAEHLNGEQRAANRSDDGVHGVPDRIDPRNFVGQEFEQVEAAGDADDPGIGQNIERLILRPECDPVEMDRQTGDEHRQIQIDPGERGEPERDGKEVQSIHAEIIGCARKWGKFSTCHLSNSQVENLRHIIPPMLDIRLIRERPDFVRERLATRGGGDEAKIDQLLQADTDRRKIETALQQLNAERNRLSKEIGAKRSRKEATEELETQVRRIGDEIVDLNRRATTADEAQRDLLFQIPNLPHESVPVGADPGANRVVRSWGEKPKLPGKVLDHVVLGEKLKLFDLERAAKLSGSGFICFTGAGARLERALINFMLELHAREHGYEEISPPFVVRRDCMIGTSQLPKFEPDMYGLEENHLFLAPTAEVPVTNFHREEILALKDLPKKFVAYTPCFRREAGSAGRETRGILRVHQFDKVELVKITTAEDSYKELETLTADAEAVLQRLNLHYRIIELCTGDLGFGAAKTYDIEVWSPGQNAYLEVSSCSNFEDYQARRMNLRYKDADGKNKFAHTLNGSGLALPRLFAALIETGQQPDGTIRLPDALQPYFGATEIR